MRVLWFSNIMLPEYQKALGLPVGNTGGWMTGLLNAARRYAPDLKVTIACQGRSPARNIDGVEFRTIEPLIGSIYKAKNAKEFMASMSRCIEDVKPDLIHFFGTECGFQTLYFQLHRSIPVVTSIQGLISGIIPHSMGGFLPYQLSRFRRLTDFAMPRPLVQNMGRDYFLRGQAEREVLARSKFICGRTDWDKAWISMLSPHCRYYHVGEVLRDVFYSGKREPSRVVSHSIYCGAALGSMLKGGIYLLEAAAYLRNKYPDVKLHFANAQRLDQKGTGVVRLREFERYILDYIRRHQLQDSVVFHPSLTAEQVANQLMTAEMFVLPSMIENSPNSLGEAMLLRTPAIATDVGGVSSIMPRTAGLLVHAGDSAELAMAIDNVFTDANAARRRADMAYEIARKRFDPASVINDLMTVYHNIEGDAR